jgi:predicted Zn-dependent peptidase
LSTLPPHLAYNRAEIDNVPVIWADVPGTFTAALIFRVGMADEVLASRGITHIVEHLAMHEVGEPPIEHNAFVDTSRTTFFASGSRDQVVAFMNRLCAVLSDLPLDRVATEREILIKEAEDSGGPIGELLNVRYGACGHGLAGCRDFGLGWLDEHHVGRWAARWFTHGNAALVCTGPPPEALRLTLPGGERNAPARARPAPAELPAITPFEPGGVALGVAGSWSVDLAVSFRVLERRLRRRVRHDLGLSYHVESTADRLDEETWHRALFADCRDEKQDQLRDEVLDVVNTLAEQGPSAEELAHEREVANEMITDPAGAIGWLDSLALDELHGTDPVGPQEMLDQVEQVTTESARAALRDALRDAIVLVPEEIVHDEEGTAIGALGETPLRCHEVQPLPAVSGRVLKPTLASRAFGLRGATMTLAEVGLTLAFKDTEPTTVHFDRCAALATWENGDRLLVGEDGLSIPIRPSHWKSGEEVVRLLERQVAADRIAPLDTIQPSPFEA